MNAVESACSWHLTVPSHEVGKLWGGMTFEPPHVAVAGDLETHVYRALLSTGAPVPLETAARLVGQAAEAVAAEVTDLERRQRIRTDESNFIVAVAGLSVVPTTHALTLASGMRWAWCAYDALGITGSLGSGAILSSCRATGEPLKLEVRGRHLFGRAVIFVPDAPDCGIETNEEWCAASHFFGSEAIARDWARREGLVGQIVAADQALSCAAESWAEVASLAV